MWWMTVIAKDLIFKKIRVIEGNELVVWLTKRLPSFHFSSMIIDNTAFEFLRYRFLILPEAKARFRYSKRRVCTSKEATYSRKRRKPKVFRIIINIAPIDKVVTHVKRCRKARPPSEPITFETFFPHRFVRERFSRTLSALLICTTLPRLSNGTKP